MKEIMCFNEKCLSWFGNHCMKDSKYLYINKLNECGNFVVNPGYSEQISETLAEQNKKEEK